MTAFLNWMVHCRLHYAGLTNLFLFVLLLVVNFRDVSGKS